MASQPEYAPFSFWIRLRFDSNRSNPPLSSFNNSTKFSGVAKSSNTHSEHTLGAFSKPGYYYSCQQLDSRYKQSHLLHRHHPATSEPALLTSLQSRS